MPDLAVIIPTHNRADLLPVALDSVLRQRAIEHGLSIEISVIDDGSTDDTPGVVSRYTQTQGTADRRCALRYHRLEKQGVVAARNFGIAHTTAPLVAFLDSDDYWHPDKLARQLLQFVGPAHADIGISHTDFRYVNALGQFTDPGPQRPTNPCVGRCLDVLMDEYLVITSSIVMRRAILDAISGDEPAHAPFDPRWTNAQDYDLVLRAARHCALAYVPEPLTLYRIHGAHGAMGNLPRAFGFHARVQLDFARRFGPSVGIDEPTARRKAAAFLLGRADACFWRRDLDNCRKLCDTAAQLGLTDESFTALHKKASRPRWLYAAKDKLDRLIGRGQH